MNDSSRSPVIEAEGLTIAREFYDFICDEALPGSGIENATFWAHFSSIVHDLTPKNRALLARRTELQAKLDAWYREHGALVDIADYESFLRRIGYLLPERADFSISTANVDPEIATIAGPQLVVPVMNARFALNAANARWARFKTRFTARTPLPTRKEPSAAKSTIRSAEPRSLPGCSTSSTRAHRSHRIVGAMGSLSPPKDPGCR